jgi:cytochrome b pre-mRNA-processing protein 3
MAFFGLLRRSRHERLAFELYGHAVGAARAPMLYADLGVPDTLDGRFDMVSVHVFLLIRRLRALPPPGPAVAQAVFDAMFNDMDVTLREMGVGDLGVGKRVKLMWEGFHGRSAAYQAALDQADRAALASALARNVWRDPVVTPGAERLAALVEAWDAHLARLDAATLLAGRVAFPPAPAALPEPARLPA